MNEKVASVSVSPTLQDLACDYIGYIRAVEQLAETTVGNRSRLMIALLRFLAVNEISSVDKLSIEHVDYYLAERGRTIKESSLNQEKQLLRGLFKYIQVHRKIPMSFNWTEIKRRREKPQRVVCYTGEQIARVIQGCDRELDKLVIALMYESGMRISEVCNLRIEDINRTEIAVIGKGRVERVVFISDSLAARLRMYLSKNGIVSGHVFRHVINHRPSRYDHFMPNGLRERIKSAFERSGHPGMHPHQLRHSFALAWLHRGGDIRTLQKILGHEHLDTTMRYLNITDAYAHRAYDKLFNASILDS